MPDVATNTVVHDKHLTMTVLMTPDMVNFSGKVHGGAILRLLDEVAYACATRYCGNYVVTVAVDQVVFRQPIHLGELVTFLANVNHTGRTSMEIGIRVVAENPRSRTKCHAMSCFFSMVAVDDAGKPTAVAPVPLETESDRRRAKAAEERRVLRSQYEEAHRATRGGG